MGPFGQTQGRQAHPLQKGTAPLPRKSFVGVRAALFFRAGVFYQKPTFRFFFAGTCRYEPTCSRYAYEGNRSIWGVARRLDGIEAAAIRCHPLSGKIRIRPGSGEMGRDAERIPNVMGKTRRGAAVSTPPMNQFAAAGENRKNKFHRPELRILVASLFVHGGDFCFGPSSLARSRRPIRRSKNQPAQVSNGDSRKRSARANTPNAPAVPAKISAGDCAGCPFRQQTPKSAPLWWRNALYLSRAFFQSRRG